MFLTTNAIAYAITTSSTTILRRGRGCQVEGWSSSSTGAAGGRERSGRRGRPPLDGSGGRLLGWYRRLGRAHCGDPMSPPPRVRTRSADAARAAAASAAQHPALGVPERGTRCLQQQGAETRLVEVAVPQVTSVRLPTVPLAAPGLRSTRNDHRLLPPWIKRARTRKPCSLRTNQNPPNMQRF